MKCPRCDAFNPDSNRYCHKCGQLITGEDSQKQSTFQKKLASAPAFVLRQIVRSISRLFSFRLPPIDIPGQQISRYVITAAVVLILLIISPKIGELIGILPGKTAEVLLTPDKGTQLKTKHSVVLFKRGSLPQGQQITVRSNEVDPTIQFPLGTWSLSKNIHLQPDGLFFDSSVTVRIDLEEKNVNKYMDKASFWVEYNLNGHFGKIRPREINLDDNYIVFVTNHFSIYSVAFGYATSNSLITSDKVFTDEKPVVLVHGLLSGSNVWNEFEKTLRTRLASDRVIYRFDYDYNLPIPQSAAKLVQGIKKVTTGRDLKVDIVAHSMGGLVARYAKEILADPHIDKIVMLGTPNFGTQIASRQFRQTLFHALARSPWIPAVALFAFVLQTYELLGDRALEQLPPGSDLFRELGEAWKTYSSQYYIIAGTKVIGDEWTDQLSRFLGQHADIANYNELRNGFGDGWVSNDFASIPKAAGFYKIDETHTRLTRSDPVVWATADILSDRQPDYFRDVFAEFNIVQREDLTVKLLKSGVSSNDSERWYSADFDGDSKADILKAVLRINGSLDLYLWTDIADVSYASHTVWDPNSPNLNISDGAIGYGEPGSGGSAEIAVLETDKTTKHAIPVIVKSYSIGASDVASSLVAIPFNRETRRFETSSRKELGTTTESFDAITYRPILTVKTWNDLGWYSFIAHAEQLAYPRTFVWRWEEKTFVPTNNHDNIDEYRIVLLQLEEYSRRARTEGSASDLIEIRKDMKTIRDLIEQAQAQ